MRKLRHVIRFGLLLGVAIVLASATGCGNKGDLVRPDSTAKAADRAPSPNEPG